MRLPSSCKRRVSREESTTTTTYTDNSQTTGDVYDATLAALPATAEEIHAVMASHGYRPYRFPYVIRGLRRRGNVIIKDRKSGVYHLATDQYEVDAKEFEWVAYAATRLATTAAQFGDPRYEEAAAIMKACLEGLMAARNRARRVYKLRTVIERAQAELDELMNTT
jgi:hypothetical protein